MAGSHGSRDLACRGMMHLLGVFSPRSFRVTLRAGA